MLTDELGDYQERVRACPGRDPGERTPGYGTQCIGPEMAN